MAEKTRAELASEDETIYIPDNVNGDIDPVEHRTSNINHADSAINKLEDNLKIAIDGSTCYTSDPSALWNNDPEHDLKHVHKKYLDDLVSVKDLTTYYVSNNGDDNTAQPGNEKLPFETIQGAIDVIDTLPVSSAAAVYVFPGLYNEDVNVNASVSISIFARNVQIFGRFSASVTVEYLNLDLQGSLISTNDLELGQTVDISCKFDMTGGTIQKNKIALNTQSCLALSGTERKTLNNVTIEGYQRSVLTGCETATFQSCLFKGATAVFRTDNCRFYDCEFQTESFVYNSVSNKNKFFNCTSVSDRGIYFEGQAYDEYYNCEITVNAQSAIQLFGLIFVNDLIFDNCKITASNSIVLVASASKLQSNLILRNCTLHATQDLYNAAVFDPLFSGLIVESNCMTNKDYTPVDPSKFQIQNRTILTTLEP